MWFVSDCCVVGWRVGVREWGVRTKVETVAIVAVFGCGVIGARVSFRWIDAVVYERLWRLLVSGTAWFVYQRSTAADLHGSGWSKRR